MTLFLILICLGLQRQLGFDPKHAHFGLNTYLRSVNQLCVKLHVNNALLAISALLLPPVIIIGLLEYLLQGIWFGSVDFLFQGIVLFFCLNACSIKNALTGYFKARQKEDEQAAFHYGLTFLGQTSAEDLVTLTRAITTRIFWHADVYLFSVLFWYIILGPVAVVLYAITRFLALPIDTPEKSCFYALAQKIHAVLDWLPARFTALGYALAGHFGHAFIHIRRYLLAGLASSNDLPLRAGLAALERDKNDVALANAEENLAALDLVDRSLVIWIVAIALFTLAAWIA